MKDIYWLLLTFFLFATSYPSLGQSNPEEDDYFKIFNVPTPDGITLEVGGLDVLPNGDLGISTRRGDVFIVQNPTSNKPNFRKFAVGLHEPLGLIYEDGALYCSERGGLTRLVDTNSDGTADLYETIFSWPLSGHYHEYSYGPIIFPDGSFFVSTNIAFGGRYGSRVPWRGWIMNIKKNGLMQPWATGMRSPAGLGIIDGELFYTDNQGAWIGSGGIWHIKKGDFTGHPAGLRWSNHPKSPLNMTEDQLYAHVNPRFKKDDEGNYISPENIEDEDYTAFFELKEHFSEVKTPAVWLPHGVLGVSNSDIKQIPKGYFGPFSGQVLVGDQGQSKIMRIHLEKIKDEYQGAVFDFRRGFQAGVVRMAWAGDGSLFVGETNRGWGAAGRGSQGLQRLVWNHHVPFEMEKILARPDGFKIIFTKPVNRETAQDLASYSVSSFIYKYHPVYGSPLVGQEDHTIKGVKVSEDRMSVRIIVENLRKYHIHHISLDGILSENKQLPLLHPSAYYTLNNIPDGEKLSLSDVSIYNSNNETRESASTEINTTTNSTHNSVEKDTPSDSEHIEQILSTYTCSSCHSIQDRQVGPPFLEIAKRNYSDKEIVDLIYNPDPSNWPDYPTPMPPMNHVPEAEILKIAKWINSLDNE